MMHLLARALNLKAGQAARPSTSDNKVSCIQRKELSVFRKLDNFNRVHS